MAEHGDRAPPRGGQVGEPDRFVGQLDAEDMAAGRVLPREPADRVADAMHARRSTEGISAGERIVYPGERWHRQARSDRVTGPQEGTEIRTVKWPERRRDQVAPAAVRPAAASCLDLAARPDPNGRTHRRWATLPGR
jgi:hypothetical protein